MWSFTLGRKPRIHGRRKRCRSILLRKTHMPQSKSVRRSLAAALALALSTPALAGQVHTAGLTESGRFDRFIVRFANGSPERADATARQRAFDGVGRAEGVA